MGGLGGNAKQVLVKKISSNRSADDSSDEELEQDLPARKVSDHRSIQVQLIIHQRVTFN